MAEREEMYELDLGRYFWPQWIRYAFASLFRLYGDDGLTYWERKRLAKRYREKIFAPLSPETKKLLRQLSEKQKAPSNTGEG